MLKFKLLNLLYFLVILGASSAQSAPILSVMTWNVEGMPVIYKDLKASGSHFKRFQILEKLLAAKAGSEQGPQVILIQEAFFRIVRKAIVRSGYPHWVAAPEAGLMILSKFPIGSHQFHAYRNCVSWDCLATKGILYAEIQIPGWKNPLQIFNTHLNATPRDPLTSEEEADAVRSLQMQEAGDFIASGVASRGPRIFGGDLNVRPGEPAYWDLAKLDFHEEALGACLLKGCRTTGAKPMADIWRETYDRLLVSKEFQVQGFRLQYEGRVKGEQVSDHGAQIFKFRVNPSILTRP